MKPSEAYLIGWLQGCTGQDSDETGIPDEQPCLAARGDGYEAGYERRKTALHTAAGFDVVTETNVKAFATWNIGGERKDLPSPPSGSGCEFHYCWMPVDTRGDNHWCKAHGGKDCPLPSPMQAATATIKWSKASDGFVSSKCGRYKTTDFVLSFRQAGGAWQVLSRFNMTQRAAKVHAQQHHAEGCASKGVGSSIP